MTSESMTWSGGLGSGTMRLREEHVAPKYATGVEGRLWSLSSCDIAPMTVQRCWWLTAVDFEKRERIELHISSLDSLLNVDSSISTPSMIGDRNRTVNPG